MTIEFANESEDATDCLRHAGNHVQHPCHRNELASENRQRAEPQQYGNGRPDRPAVSMLEIVADGIEFAIAGNPP